MPQSSAGRKHGGDQSDGSGSAPKSQRAKTGRGSEDNEKKSSSKKLKDVEISVPIVYGTISFWLGKKANEYHSHKWSVYVRGATNEDLSSVVKKVVFQLHPSFNNPTRTVESPPFELQESGWGEFEIQISLHFHSDVSDKQLDLYHHLKLYPEVESGPQSTKKPVVVESYDEIVFHEPSEGFFARVQNHPAVIVPRLPASLNLLNAGLIDNINEKKRGDTKDHPYNQWFTNFSEADELLKLAAARQQVQAHIVKLKRQLTVMDGQPQQSKPISGPLSWGPDNFSTRIVDFANTRAFAFNNVCDGGVLLLKVFHSNVYGGSVSDNNDGLHFFQISTMTMIRIYLQAMGTVQGMSSLF